MRPSGRNITMDNFLTSILTQFLLAEGLTFVGTLRETKVRSLGLCCQIKIFQNTHQSLIPYYGELRAEVKHGSYTSEHSANSHATDLDKNN